jgi:hypothetical protein
VAGVVGFVAQMENDDNPDSLFLPWCVSLLTPLNAWVLFCIVFIVW